MMQRCAFKWCGLVSALLLLAAAPVVVADSHEGCYGDRAMYATKFSGASVSPGAPDRYTLTAFKADGSMVTWGDSNYGGVGGPVGSGYISVASSGTNQAALNGDGSIVEWGFKRENDWTPAPIDSGYKSLTANQGSYAALKADGSITSWGYDLPGGRGAPTDSGYVSITTNEVAYAALKADGSIAAWGSSPYGGSGAPTDSGYLSITANAVTFAALKNDGSIFTWGDSRYGGAGPVGTGYVAIIANYESYAALKSDGSVTTWGSIASDDIAAPTDNGYVDIVANWGAFAALKSDGSVASWGRVDNGGVGAPTGNGYISITRNGNSFAALKADGSIVSWGGPVTGTQPPTANGYTAITSNLNAYAALGADGSIAVWGSSTEAGSGAPTDSGYVAIVANTKSFAAMKADGSITSWGQPGFFADMSFTNAPTDSGYVSINGMTPECFQLLNTPGDFDNDGIADAIERTSGTNPYHLDSDLDGLHDNVEGVADTDSDGRPDALESSLLDVDADGVPDQLDSDDASDLNDSDGDGVDNGTETRLGTDPLDPTSFPGGTGAIRLEVKAVLQGAYDSVTGLMRDDLRAQNLLPQTQPYAVGMALDNANGNTIQPGMLGRTGDTAPVDWVLIELFDVGRQTRLLSKPALIQRDGRVVDNLSGDTVLVFPEVGAGNYHVVLRHRNHLGVMTLDTVSMGNSHIATVDFSLPATPVYGDNARFVSGTVAVLWAGDANGSDSITANGPDNDATALLATVLSDVDNEGFNSNYRSFGYHLTDYNMDGASLFSGPDNDSNLLLGNVLIHPGNENFSANYIINGSIP